VLGVGDGWLWLHEPARDGDNTVPGVAVAQAGAGDMLAFGDNRSADPARPVAERAAGREAGQVNTATAVTAASTAATAIAATSQGRALNSPITIDARRAELRGRS
jgi:hypothetical protein